MMIYSNDVKIIVMVIKLSQFNMFDCIIDYVNVTSIDILVVMHYDLISITVSYPPI